MVDSALIAIHEHHENDVMHLRKSVNADVIGERRSVVIPIGATGTIVFVHGDPLTPLAYEIEFYIQDQNCYALVTIGAEEI